MNTVSDLQMDTKATGDVDTNMNVAADKTTSNVVSASEACGTSAVEQPPTDVDVSEQIEGRATSDGKDDADEEAKSDGEVDLSGEADVSEQFVPTSMLRRLPIELRMQIYELVLADGVPGAPGPIEGEERFTRTLKMPPITMVDYQTREETLGSFLRGKQFSVQLPRDPQMISKLQSLQEDAMDRRRGLRDYPEETLKRMKEFAEETEKEFYEYFEDTRSLDLCPFSDVESLVVTYNGRFRLNIEGGFSNWDPRSLLVGFRCYSDAGFEKCNNWKDQIGERKRLNADGELDWTDFGAVRKAFVAALIKNESSFENVTYIDVLLHPMIQPLVKALCMFASGQKKPLRWVDVIAVEYISIPQGVFGVESAYLSYEDAVYESEPDDGFSVYRDEWRSSDEEASRGSRESSAGERDEDDEDEDEDEDEEKSDDAGNSDDGSSRNGEESVGDVDKSDGDHPNQVEAVVISEEGQENPKSSDELEAEKISTEEYHTSEA